MLEMQILHFGKTGTTRLEEASVKKEKKKH